MVKVYKHNAPYRYYLKFSKKPPKSSYWYLIKIYLDIIKPEDVGQVVHRQDRYLGSLYFG